MVIKPPPVVAAFVAVVTLIGTSAVSLASTESGSVANGVDGDEWPAATSCVLPMTRWESAASFGPAPNDCCTCGAGAKVPLPAWLALITHMPVPINDTVEPEIEHTLVADGSIEMVTVRLEEAVAVTV